MSLTRTPVSMLQASGQPNSDVRFDGKSVVLGAEDNVNNLGVTDGNYDDTNGILTLTLANGSQIKVEGFITQGSIGLGQPGPNGVGGIDGTDGMLGVDGEQGLTGCAGPAGSRGDPGPPGPVGPQGPQGNTGATGPQGLNGADGVVQIYIKSTDPGAVGAGALWIKP